MQFTEQVMIHKPFINSREIAAILTAITDIFGFKIPFTVSINSNYLSQK